MDPSVTYALSNQSDLDLLAEYLGNSSSKFFFKSADTRALNGPFKVFNTAKKEKKDVRDDDDFWSEWEKDTEL